MRTRAKALRVLRPFCRRAAGVARASDHVFAPGHRSKTAPLRIWLTERFAQWQAGRNRQGEPVEVRKFGRRAKPPGFQAEPGLRTPQGHNCGDTDPLHDTYTGMGGCDPTRWQRAAAAGARLRTSLGPRQPPACLHRCEPDSGRRAFNRQRRWHRGNRAAGRTLARDAELVARRFPDRVCELSGAAVVRLRDPVGRSRRFLGPVDHRERVRSHRPCLVAVEMRP
jgi:hypothetical protein